MRHVTLPNSTPLRLIPTVLLPLSLLAYTSIFGIISSALMIFVVLFDGFSKHDPPGSFWSPAETNLGVGNWNDLGLAFGLFMAGVGWVFYVDEFPCLLSFSSQDTLFYLHSQRTWLIRVNSTE